MLWALFAFASSLVTGVNSILQKEILKKLHAVQLMTVSTFMALVFGLAFLPFYNFAINGRGLLLVAISAVLQAVAMIFTIRAMRHLEVSVVAPFFNLGTALTAVLAFIFFRELLTFVDVLGITLLVAGGYILELKSRNLLSPIKEVIRSTSLHYLLGGVMFFSVHYLLAKYILETVQPIPFFFYSYIFCFIIFAGITFFVYKGFTDIKEGFRNGRWLIPLMGILLVLETVFMYEALERGEASLVVPLYRTWTLWAVIFGGRLFHEDHLLKKTVASILMILGAAIILI